jgi:hypothetical protein
MKKLLTAIALIACLILPLSAMAMTTIADNDLSTVTGQAGVSINIDMSATISVGTLAWGDSDGFTGYTNMGFVGMQGMTLTITMAGRTDGPFATTAANDVGYLRNQPITIDVGANGVGAALVRIGIPTLHVTISTLDTNIFVSGGALATGPSSTVAQQLGEVYIAGLDLKLGQTTDPGGLHSATNEIWAQTFDAGYVTIGAAGAGNTGVNIGFDVKIGSLSIGTLSYGNTTSILSTNFGGAATAGFVGIKNLTLNDITIAGGVAIGIGTLNGPALGATAFGTPTMVNIIIADGTTVVIPGAIYGTIQLASDKALTTNVGDLGNFYIGGVSVTFNDSTSHSGYNSNNFSAKSIVQIWAH